MKDNVSEIEKLKDNLSKGILNQLSIHSIHYIYEWVIKSWLKLFIFIEIKKELKLYLQLWKI